jgi:hypothetical protein
MLEVESFSQVRSRWQEDQTTHDRDESWNAPIPPLCKKPLLKRLPREDVEVYGSLGTTLFDPGVLVWCEWEESTWYVRSSNLAR